MQLKNLKYFTFLILLLGVFCYLFSNIEYVNAQETSLRLEKKTITTNEYLQMNLTIKNEKFREKDDFPEIKNFIKRGKSTKEFTRIVGASVEKSSTITQHYQAQREGKFKIAPFSIRVNGRGVRFNGATVVVQKPSNNNKNQKKPIDIFDLFYNQKQEQSYANIKPVTGGFLSITTDKKDIYVGEGVNVTVTLFLEDNPKSLGSEVNLEKVGDLAKKFTFPNCLEQRFALNINMFEKVDIRGKKYNKADLLQTTFYPYTSNNIEIPQFKLEVTKYERSRTGFFSYTRGKPITFSVKSRPKTIKVKPLPPHPLKDKVVVGEFKLKENINGREFETGNKINYFATILGRGNIALINKLEPVTRKGFDIYPPSLNQDLIKQNRVVSGRSLFQFYMIGNEPGEYDMGDYFQWVYFDPVKQKYDTLKSKLKIKLTGDKIITQSTDINSPYIGFYTSIPKSKNQLKPLKIESNNNYIYNILAGFCLTLVAFFIYRQAKMK